MGSGKDDKFACRSCLPRQGALVKTVQGEQSLKVVGPKFNMTVFPEASVREEVDELTLRM